MPLTDTERPTLLVVDDVPENIDILGSILAEEYTVKVATNGAKALQLAAGAKPDLILLDIMMPDMDGYQVCSALKLNPETRDIPVIFVTALSESVDEEKGFAAGCVDYLTKPINPAVTLVRVKTHLALRKAHKELEVWNSSLQQQIVRDYKRQKAQLRLYEMASVPCSDLLDIALEETLELTGSSIGYIYQYDEQTQLFTLYSWSKLVMPDCSIIHKQTVYELEKTGLWGEAVRQRRPIITNDYSAPNQFKKGYPEGHVHLIRHMNLPILRAGKIVAVVGVGNKTSDYTDDDAHQLELYLNAVWNMVERQKAIQEMEAARKVAEDSSRLKSDLLANLSHELRTPLNGVIGGAQLLAFTELDNEQQEYLDLVETSAANELIMVNNLLELVSLESSAANPENRPFSLRNCVEEAIRVHSGTINAKGLTITSRIPEQIREDFMGDSVRIRQILHTLIGNAQKFTENGGIEIILKLLQSEDGSQMVCFEVKDTGIGIAPDKLEQIFEAFYQSDMSNTRRFGGLGLGLNICRRLAAALNGRLWAESVQGEGSSFHLEVPLRIMSQTDNSLQIERHILLVDDDRVNAISSSGMLRKLGHSVTVATNGKEALRLWQRSRFDLIFMDIQMPVMNGFEALQRIRAEEAEQKIKRTPIVAQTAYARMNYHESFFSAGFDGFIAKPFVMEDLDRVISEYCTVN